MYSKIYITFMDNSTKYGILVCGESEGSCAAGRYTEMNIGETIIEHGYETAEPIDVYTGLSEQLEDYDRSVHLEQIDFLAMLEELEYK